MQDTITKPEPAPRCRHCGHAARQHSRHADNRGPYLLSGDECRACSCLSYEADRTALAGLMEERARAASAQIDAVMDAALTRIAVRSAEPARRGELALLWELAEGISDADKATGALLSRLCVLTGTSSTQASFSAVPLRPGERVVAVGAGVSDVCDAGTTPQQIAAWLGEGRKFFRIPAPLPVTLALAPVPFAAPEDMEFKISARSQSISYPRFATFAGLAEDEDPAEITARAARLAEWRRLAGLAPDTPLEACLARLRQMEDERVRQDAMERARAIEWSVSAVAQIARVAVDVACRARLAVGVMAEIARVAVRAACTTLFELDRSPVQAPDLPVVPIDLEID